MSRVVLLLSLAPAAALMAYAGWKFAHALVDPADVQRRIAHGDLTYFMADFGFAVATGLGLFWCAIVGLANAIGRRHRQAA